MFEKYEVDLERVADNKTILNIDLDSLLFKVAAVAETKHIEVSDENGLVWDGKLRTDFWKSVGISPSAQMDKKGAFMEEKGLTLNIIRTPCMGMGAMMTNAEKWIGGIQDNVGIPPERTSLMVDGEGNFRKDLLTVEQYKASRNKDDKPIMLSKLVNKFINTYNPDIIKGVECDDALSILQYKGYQDYLKTGKTSHIVSTIDKDSYTLPGFINNYNKHKGQFINSATHLVPSYTDDLGEIKLKNGKIKGCGFKFYIAQCLLVGDTTDHAMTYRSSPHMKRKYGETKCFREINDIESPVELLEHVKETWGKWFPSGVVEYTDFKGGEHSIPWYEYANLCFKQTHMLRVENDKTDIYSLYKHFGVEL